MDGKHAWVESVVNRKQDEHSRRKVGTINGKTNIQKRDSESKYKSPWKDRPRCGRYKNEKKIRKTEPVGGNAAGNRKVCQPVRITT